MPQLYTVPRCVPMPFVLRGGGSAASSVQLVAPVTLTWQDGHIDTWTPGPTFVVQPAASYTPTGPSIDTTAFNWLIVALRDAAAPVLVHELTYATMDAVVSGQWAALYLVTGTQIVPIPQRMVAGSLPTPYLDTALLSIDPATHQPTWELPNPGDLLIGSLSPIAPHAPVWERLPVPATGGGQLLTYEGAGVVDWHASTAPTPPTGAPNPVGTATLLTSAVGAGATILRLGHSAPPQNWQATSFDDSAWPAAANAGSSPIPGTVQLGPAGLFDPTPGESYALRQHCTISTLAGVASATLTILADSTLLGAYVNGALVAAHPFYSWLQRPLVPYTVAIPASVLAAGDNVFAAYFQNDASEDVGPYGGSIVYSLAVSNAPTAGSAGPSGAMPTGATEGSLLYFHAGSWSILLPGTAGAKLTMVGGAPAWV